MVHTNLLSKCVKWKRPNLQQIFFLTASERACPRAQQHSYSRAHHRAGNMHAKGMSHLRGAVSCATFKRTLRPRAGTKSCALFTSSQEGLQNSQRQIRPRTFA